MKKPLASDYTTILVEPKGGDPVNKKWVSFDSKGYAKAAESYIEHLEKVMKLTSGNMRDIAACMGQAHKDYGAVCELADRLYNETISK